ncbi:hypothetical protein L9F63_009233, partial [Diploptera punctata]
TILLIKPVAHELLQTAFLLGLLSVAQTNGSHRVTNLDCPGCFPELRMEPSQNFRRFTRSWHTPTNFPSKPQP